MIRYLKRTEAGCGLGLGDDQRYIATGEIVPLDEDDPVQHKVLDDLSGWSHGWEQVTESGAPIPEADRYVRQPVERPERHLPDPGAFFGDGEPLPGEGSAVDSPPSAP